MGNDSSTPAGEITRYYARAESTTGGAWKTDYVDVTDEVAALRADAVKRTSELHTWKETATTLRAANDKLVTALAEVRPVVQAACEERDLSSLVSDDFRDAVDAFRAAQQETTAHHESNDDLADLCDPTGESDDVMGAKHGE